MEINYSSGPRYIDGVNIDVDSNSTTQVKIQEAEITAPVTGLGGAGYQPGQKNRDNSEL